MLQTDIDRLHEQVLNPSINRRCGKTFTFCQFMAGVIVLGEEKDIAIVTGNVPERDYVLHLLQDVLEEQGIKCRRTSRWRMEANGKVVHVVLPNLKDIRGHERVERAW